MSTTTDQSDREKILAHVRSIFDAYVRRDRETIERTHTRDWRGFLIPSSEIERGIEAYMKHADNSLERLGGTGYELHDTEIQLYGDVGVLYYVATYSGRDPEGGCRCSDGPAPSRPWVAIAHTGITEEEPW